MLGSTIAPSVFGYLIDRVGVRMAFYAVAGVGVLATAVTGIVVVQFADRERHRQTAGD
jgi:MFS family permease